jgi:alanine racemase
MLNMTVVQAYVGDRLGYSNNPITRNMTIALVDAGYVDGADDVSKVSCLHWATSHSTF